MKKKRRLKKKFVVFLYIYALFFVSYFTLSTVAKYTSLLNKNGDVGVAKWNVSIAGEDDKRLPTMIIGVSETYQNYELSVTSESEVAINYSVVISNVPTGVRVQVGDNIYDESSNVVTIPNLGSFTASETDITHNHVFTIIVPEGVEPFSDQTLDIDVIFTQTEL